MDLPIVIVGLGNPGRKYEGTRHNAGFDLLDALVREQNNSWTKKREFEAEIAQIDWNGRRILLVKPQTYVNESGRSVGAICRYYRIESATKLVVVYDEINLELGHLRISVGGSAGGHNGVRSLIRHLGPEFVRFRIGIGPREPAGISLTDFVLGRFSQEQRRLLESKEKEFVEALHLLIDSGANSAMNQVNQKQKIQNEPNESEL